MQPAAGNSPPTRGTILIKLRQIIGAAEPRAAALFALAIAVLMFYQLWVQGRAMMATNSLIILVISLVGSFAGHLLARLLTALVRPRRARTRFIAAAVSLAICVVAALAGLFWLQFMSQSIFESGPIFSRTWLIQQYYAALTSFGVFAVIGLRLLLPGAAILIILDAAIFTWRRN